jgi:RNA polymerase sigma-70 factor (ECF subfamily)
VPDDRLRLLFTCCHPALDPAARVALTLRLVCAAATPDVARAFPVPEPITIDGGWADARPLLG